MQNKFESILIVEDEIALHNSLKEIFKYFSKTIYTATNGQEALEMYKKQATQLIISDIQMPKMNGIDFCKEIKKIDPNQYFVFLTAFNDNKLLHEAIKLHVTSFLIKPLILDDLKKEFNLIFKQIKIQEDIAKQEKHNYLQNVINAMIDPIRVVDKEHSTISINDASKSTKLVKNNDTKIIDKVLKTGKADSSLQQYVDENNNQILKQVTISPLKNKKNEIYAVVEHCSDVTELINTQEKLHYEKNYDSFTNLPNRHKFIKQLEESINESSHHKVMSCVILLDIDDLKTVNESFGHEVGDDIILRFSQIIKSIIRKEDRVARLGGDSFAVLLNNIEDKMAPVRLIKEIKEKTNDEIIEIMFNQLQITFSSGIAIYPDDGITTVALFKNADSALHESKVSGRNEFRFYTQELTRKAFDKVILESNIKYALKHNEFSLYFQPQYNSLDNHLIGMEVLIRWKDGPLGIISPEKFIPYLEYSGLIVKVGDWILENIFQTVSMWNKKGYNYGKVCVNVSLNQLKDGKGFIKNIKRLLDKTKCNPNDIGIEITESALMQNYTATIETLEELSSMGFYILIDDFGTGYSSLSHLKKMPINKLKIDKSFIDGIVDNEDDKIIVKTMINLAKNLHLDLIAEGVEKKEQIEFLKSNACYDIQGFYYSKPLAKDELEKIIS